LTKYLIGDRLVVEEERKRVFTSIRRVRYLTKSPLGDKILLETERQDENYAVWMFQPAP
jgi:hypothetical protein